MHCEIICAINRHAARPARGPATLRFLVCGRRRAAASPRPSTWLRLWRVGRPAAMADGADGSGDAAVARRASGAAASGVRSARAAQPPAAPVLRRGAQRWRRPRDSHHAPAWRGTTLLETCAPRNLRAEKGGQHQPRVGGRSGRHDGADGHAVGGGRGIAPARNLAAPALVAAGALPMTTDLTQDARAATRTRRRRAGRTRASRLTGQGLLGLGVVAKRLRRRRGAVRAPATAEKCINRVSACAEPGT